MCAVAWQACGTACQAVAAAGDGDVVGNGDVVAAVGNGDIVAVVSENLHVAY